MTKEQEKNWIDEIQNGNHRSFEKIIKQYQNLVAHIIFKMVSDVSVREDLCQDVFLKVYRNLGRFKFESKLSTWIGKIAFNTCLNYLEKKKVPLYDDFTSDDQSFEYSEENDNPQQITMSNDMAQRLHREIDQLPPRYGTVLVLFHIQEMSYEEIGELMDMPEGTVKNYLFRARKYLKERLISRFQKEEIWQ